jgi:two-component system chemotaxis response regulator CheB
VRVLVAEDSITARELLVQILGSDPGVEVAGCATNGAEAVEMTAQLRPSLVLMDIDMPVLDGFGATRRIMTETPTPIIIITATRRLEDVELSLEAIRHGALALLPKPGWPGSPHAGISPERLVAQVKALAAVRVVRRMALAREPGTPRTAGAASAAAGARAVAPAAEAGGEALAGGTVVDIVGVAASTGGPPALAGLIGSLPAGFPAPVLVVQHLPDGFAPGFAAWLAGQGRLPVRLAIDGERLSGGTVFVAPSGSHLEVEGNRIRLRAGPPVGGHLPAATTLFASLAALGPRAAAVVLTGMGDDGLEGALALRRAGGSILAQDRATSVVFGMPGAVAAAGIADLVAPVELLATRLATLARGSSVP